MSQHKQEKLSESQEENNRPLRGKTGKFISWLAAGIALFHIWANTLGNLSDLWRNCLHFCLLGFLAFVIYPGVKRKRLDKPWLAIDLFLGLVIISSSIYLILFEEALHQRNEVPLLFDLIFAAIAVILALELARRTSGYIIPLLAIFLLTYVLWWGEYLEGIFSIRSMSLSRILYRMFFTDEGLFGMIATISSTYVFMFILFAAFLLKSGGGDFIIKLSHHLLKKIAGGPALVAVMASGLMGTISGSAVANTVSTGSITIPMMKKAGFSPKFAAAVETASSTGGQIMPPIMGAGAFIMAQWTQISYSTIIGVALLPALLYFTSIAISVYLEAKKLGIKKAETSFTEDPAGRLVRKGAHFFIPIIILIGMLVAGFTPTFTAGFAILAVVVSSWFNKSHRMRIQDIVDALFIGTRNMITTGILLVTVGIVVGIINMTGVSITFSQLVVQWSGSSVLLALVLITAASLLLGMGLPVTAAYVMVAVLTAPALTTMGVPLLAAHMIIFWLSQDSNVTPPVCLAAYAASSIAGSRPMATGVASWKLAKGLYIMPLMFAYTGLVSGGWLERLTVFSFALAGFYAFALFFTGYLFRPLNFVMRAVSLGCAIALFWPGIIWINIVGLLLLGLVLWSQTIKT